MTRLTDQAVGLKPAPLIISRKFAASRARVFQAWSSGEHMARWFSPETYTVSEARVDFRVGGVCEICMRAPDGQEHWSKGHYVEIAPGERLVIALNQVDAEDRVNFTALTTVTFEDVHAGALMTVRQEYEIFNPAALGSVDGAPEGWRTTLDKLEAEVARIRRAEVGGGVIHASFTLERRYAASPARLFRALTDVEAKARWFTGDFVTLERTLEARPGGRESLKGRWPDGTVTHFDAVYFDVIADQRLVYAYDMWVDDRKLSVSLATLELTPDGDGVRLILTEQGAFLDGYDDAGSREQGTSALLDRLGAALND